MRKLTVIATAALALIVVSAASALAAPAQSGLRHIAAYGCTSCSKHSPAVAHGMEVQAPMETAGVRGGWGAYVDECGCCHKCCERCCCPRHFDPPVVCFHDHEDLHRDLVSRWHAPWQQTYAWLN